jgi:hypothetical protein
MGYVLGADIVRDLLLDRDLALNERYTANFASVSGKRSIGVKFGPHHREKADGV